MYIHIYIYDLLIFQPENSSQPDQVALPDLIIAEAVVASGGPVPQPAPFHIYVYLCI